MCDAQHDSYPDERIISLEEAKKKMDNEFGSVRTFETGATRDSDDGKLDYEGFLSPIVLQRYAQYMHQHRVQSDGTMRDSDNWQKGIPPTQYIKSMFRHFMDLWMIHRGWMRFDEKSNREITADEALCAIIFNAMGFLHEILDVRPRFPRSTPYTTIEDSA